MNCKQCKFFKKIPQSTANGLCLRKPPQICMIQNPQSGQFTTETIFPVLGADNWCGEYRAALTDVSGESKDA